MPDDTGTYTFFSTIDVPLHHGPTNNTVEWFQITIGMQSHTSNRVLTAADTNVPVNGGHLPHGWRFKVDRWHVRVGGPRVLLRDDAWWEWCSWTQVRFEVRWRDVGTLPLDELIRIPRTREPHFTPAIDIPEQTLYRVSLNPQRPIDDWPRVRDRILEESPMYAVIDPKRWPPIKLRCFLSGQLERP